MASLAKLSRNSPVAVSWSLIGSLLDKLLQFVRDAGLGSLLGRGIKL
jgi:hypothetical protein